ncbi:MAG: hypothetical protein DRO11_02090 [Methanobacteriota archaeon]|nr:MAG: hypothetical protein DRO11_02090 [Euryarchaeota archaeon]
MIVRAFRYGYVAARIRGRKSWMLTKSDYESLISAEEISSLIRKLGETRYGKYFSELTQTPSVQQLEKTLAMFLEDEMNLIKSELGPRRAGLFNALYKQLELTTLKEVLRLVVFGLDPEMVDWVTPFGRYDTSLCRSLAQADNLGQTLSRIPEEKNLVDKLRVVADEEGSPAQTAAKVEIVLDNYGCGMVWRALQKLGGADKRCVSLVGFLLDMANIVTLIRAKKIGMRPEQILDMTTKSYYKLGEKIVAKLAGLPSDGEVVNQLATGAYRDILSPLTLMYTTKKDVLPVEVAFKRFHAWECEKTFFGAPFHLGETLAYYYLTRYEIEDIRAIVNGKSGGLPPGAIRENLVLHQPLTPKL